MVEFQGMRYRKASHGQMWAMTVCHLTVLLLASVFLCFRVSNQLSCNQKKIGTFYQKQSIKARGLGIVNFMGKSNRNHALAWTHMFTKRRLLVNLMQSHVV